MTGPEHYREAEVLLMQAANYTTEDPDHMRIAEITAARARAHATLALVAVNAYGGEDNGWTAVLT